MGGEPETATWRRVGGLEVLGWPALDRVGVAAVVTTRHGGVSAGPYRSLNLGLHVGDDPRAVVENRRRAAGAVGAEIGDLVFARQVHGRDVAVVDGSHRGRGSELEEDALADCDVLVTTSSRPVLTIMVADCVPLVLVDPRAGVLAVVHAGWRGTAAGAAAAAVSAMAALGADAARVVAGIGPAVSPRTYQVGAEVAAAVSAAAGPEPVPAGARGGERHPQDQGERPVATPAGGDRWLVDLAEANRRILVAAGLPAHAVHVAPCTTGGDGPFYSDRQARPCGRMALLARLAPPAGPPEAAGARAVAPEAAQ